MDERALSSSLPGVEVARTEVLDQHSGTTGRLRLRLHYASGPTGPDTVFVKLPPFDEWQRAMVAATDMGRREARFYAGPAAEAPMRIPTSYFSAFGDEPTDYVIVLEDLEASGCRFVGSAERHADEHGQELIEALARLHARFWDDPRFGDELAWVQPAMRGEFGAQLVDSARQQFGADLPPVFTELCLLYAEHHERICEVLDEGEQTLIHGDAHIGNQFVADDGVGLYDWAVLSRSPGIRDVAYYLGSVVPDGAEARLRGAVDPRLPRRAGRGRRGRAVVRGPLAPVPADRPVLVGRGGHHGVDGEQVATDRGGHAGHDPRHPGLRRPRHPGGPPRRVVTGRGPHPDLPDRSCGLPS